MKYLLSLIMAVMFLGGQAVADDNPCADEIGAGYGLCMAYCDAMNCDEIEFQEATDAACERVSANYLKIVGHPIPGLVCPVWSEPQLDLVGTSNLTTQFDSGSETHGYDVSICPGLDATMYRDTEYTISTREVAEARVGYCGRDPITSDTIFIGTYTYRVLNKPNINTEVILTQAEYEVCRDELIAHQMTIN